MSREEFIKNYLYSEQIILLDQFDGVKGSEIPEVKIVLSLIGSVYDLQQQIAQLQEKVDESNQTKDY